MVVCVLASVGLEAASDPFDFDLTTTKPSAGGWEVSGFLESRNQYLTSRHDWLSSRVLAQLQGKWAQGAWSAFAVGHGELDRATASYRSPARGELVESWLRFDGASVEVTVGKQRVAWGTADGVSTIDRVNALDLRDPIGNARTPSRRPSWLLRVRQTAAIGVLEAVWLPRGRDRKIAEPGSPWEARAIGDWRREGGGIADPHRGEVGVRFTRYGEGLDWGLAAFDGYTDAATGLSQADGNSQLVPERLRTFNANAAFGLARSTLRAEIAVTPDAPGFANTPGDRVELWQSVLGWDRTFFADLYVNAQVFWLQTSEEGEDIGTTFAITKQWFDDAATIALRGQTSRWRPQAVELSIEHAWTDALATTLRGLVFSAAEQNFRHNDFIELSLRWSF